MRPAECRFFVFVALGLMLCLCSPPPPMVQPEDLGPVFAPLYPNHDVEAVTAFGEADIAMSGEAHSGSVETKWTKSGFQADFYGPLGVLIASIHADSINGLATIRDKEYVFNVKSTMEALPFSWGSDLTFGEFAKVMTGRLPAAIKPQLEKRPDSVFQEKKTIFALWKTDSLCIQAKIGRRTEKIERITLIFKKKQPFLYLTFESFKEGIAHKIELRENDANYFLIKYTKVKSS